MADDVLPGLGLNAFYMQGGSGWTENMDGALLALSVLTQLSVASKVTPLPGTPTEGMIYIVPSNAGGNPNKIAAYHNGAWNYFTPKVGMLAFLQDTHIFTYWTGTAWGTPAFS